MGKSERKKELLASYKARPVAGGVCLVRNGVTGRVWLFSARDLQAQRNRFQFAAATETPLHPSLAPDFRAHGAASFAFETPETLEQGEDQTDRAFAAELEALEALWRERLTAEGAEFYPT